jgi:hypothetical protein
MVNVAEPWAQSIAVEEEGDQFQVLIAHADVASITLVEYLRAPALTTAVE